MRPFIYYVYLAFAGTAKWELLKLGNIEENLLPDPHIMIFPFLLYKLEPVFFIFRSRKDKTAGWSSKQQTRGTGRGRNLPRHLY
jgi:hypothetical protein